MGEMKRFLLCGFGAVAGFAVAAVGWLIVSIPIAYLIGRLYPGGHSDLSFPSDQSCFFIMFFLFVWPWLALAGLYHGWWKTEAYLDRKYPRPPQGGPSDKMMEPVEPEQPR
jgi:hypothetical protein